MRLYCAAPVCLRIFDHCVVCVCWSYVSGDSVLLSSVSDIMRSSDDQYGSSATDKVDLLSL